MGWTFTHKPQSIKAAQYLRDRVLNCSNDSGTWQVVADAFVQRSVFYAVVQRTFTDGRAPYHFLAVVLVKFCRGEYNMGWKDLTDTMGPCETTCPEKILDIADKLAPCTPEYDPSGYAKEWRETCRVAITKRRSAPKPGVAVRFDNPIRFQDGSELSEFTYVKGSVFTGSTGFRYRISKWRDMNYRVA